MTAFQSSIGGHFSGNNNSNNTSITNNYGIQVPSYVPGTQTFTANPGRKLIAMNFCRNLWRNDKVRRLGDVATEN